MPTEPGHPGPDAELAAYRRRQEELGASTARALTGLGGLRYRAGHPVLDGAPVAIAAPHVHPPADSCGTDRRGAADALAQRLRHSDRAVHQELLPEDPVARLVVEVAEQCRVESLLATTEPGVAGNLARRFSTWSRDVESSGLLETAGGMMLYATIRLIRRWVGGEAFTAREEDLLEDARFQLSPVIGHELRGLRRLRDDQAAFGEAAVRLAARVAELHAATVHGEGPASRAERVRGDLALLVSADLDDDGAPPASDGQDTGGGRPAYRVFTREHDRVSRAQALVRAEALRGHREEIDSWVAEDRVNVPRLARTLETVFASPQLRGWTGGHDDGIIDGRRLARMIATPAQRAVFRRRRPHQQVHGGLTILIDCSGSMRRHSRSIAVAADAIGRACDLLGLAAEVLGFTTRTWNGATAVAEWIAAGRPAEPGRLSELEHIVFAEHGQPWSRSRVGLGALLDGHRYRESVDGEAVQWAGQRLRAMAATGPRVLLTISDGGPMDGATALVNAESFLDDHLRMIVEEEERNGTAVLALGFGADLSPYYQRSVVLEADEHRADVVVRAALDLVTATAVGRTRGG